MHPLTVAPAVFTSLWRGAEIRLFVNPDFYAVSFRRADSGCTFQFPRPLPDSPGPSAFYPHNKTTFTDADREMLAAKALSTIQSHPHP